jgi:microcompartment protein CcmK/EutM
MKVGRVVGRVVLSQKIPELPVGRWLLVSPWGRSEALLGDRSVISADASPIVFDDLGASEGDLIGYTEGGEATRPFDHPVPIDAYNCCILDSVEILEKESDV